MRRGYKFLSVCTAFLILIISFSVFSFADNPPAMVACPLYPSSDYLPYGKDTEVFMLKSVTTIHWFFYARSEYVDSSFPNIWTCYCYKDSASANNNYYVSISSYSPIIHVTWTTAQLTKGPVGDFDSTLQMYVCEDFDPGINTYTPVVTSGYHYLGYSLPYAISNNMISGSRYWATPTVCAYPSDIQSAVASINENSDLMTQYYNSLNSKLNALSIDVSYVQGQNDELLSEVSELRSELAEQGTEYQSALSSAQSEIQSNANAAASQAVDDINNAGEDMSDINDNIDEVNDIVDQLDEWISELDVFADRIDDAADGVADALDTGSDLLSNFLDICPPIVLALFAFALVFLVVRKIIGR